MFSTGSLSFFPKSPLKPSKPHKLLKLQPSICNLYVKNSMDVPPTASATNAGFKNLMESFTVEVQKADNRPLNVPLIASFTIASSRLDKVENVVIGIELKNGCVGWGEAPILPFVAAEDQPTAMAKAKEACEMLMTCSFMTLGSALGEIGDVLPGNQFASIPIVSPAEAAALASKYQKQGFKTLKVKVGKNLKADIEVLQVKRAALS
ncbi:L-Ala-D/L-amino acid epimerase-like isoform X2 [Durio zibethinus]|uniref:L-Ala-D/L-amino acid epimerase-like isoform X2 n=1 Tax=Durio zibethinus TaxID=66656 RepID=A0A6P5Y959_DURZI|nr:L-Ala-D/L-amino acid epimerase-like isoform X2 [Durio zibethinus]